MLCSVYTTIAGEYDGPGFCTPIGVLFFAQGQKCVGKMVQIEFFAPRAPDGNLKRHKIHFLSAKDGNFNLV